MIGVIGATVGQALEKRGVDAAKLEATLRYGFRSELLALYTVVYLGLVIADWNLIGLFYLVLYPPLEPVLRTLVGLANFVTTLVGYGIAAAGVVSVLKTVVEDAVGETSHGRSERDR